jgi:heptosyltransferase-3
VEILVLHPGALGDIILSLPALLLLRRHYSSARLTIAANLDYVNAVACCYVDEARSFNTLPLHHIYSSDPLPAEDLRFWGSFDRILSWFGAGDDTLRGRLVTLGREVLVSSWMPAAGERRHVAQIFVESLYPWVPPAGSIPLAPIKVDESCRSEARSWLQQRGCPPSAKLLALHPGAGSAAKRWDIRGFETLARDHLREKGRILLVVGPAEAGMSRELARDLAPGHVLLADSMPLRQLAALLACCSAYVGNDSGVSHLAAGLGIRSVVLFGPTSPGLWAPLGKHVTVIAEPVLSGISPERVREALEKRQGDDRGS